MRFDQRRVSPPADAGGMESAGAPPASPQPATGNGVIAQPKKIRGVGYGDIFKGEFVKLKPRLPSTDSEEKKEKVSETQHEMRSRAARGPPTGVTGGLSTGPRRFHRSWTVFRCISSCSSSLPATLYRHVCCFTCISMKQSNLNTQCLCLWSG